MRKRGFLGRDLENAVDLACVSYKRLGRGEIKKTAASSIWVKGQQIWTRKGDVDFVGDADGRAFRAECKETHEDALPLGLLEKRQHQLDKLASAQARGCISGFIIGFLPEWSCWWVPWVEIKDFLAAPWRRSISRNMCAAWGLQLPIVASPSGKIAVKFLDGVPFAERANAIAAVNADRLANPLELDLDEPRKPRVSKPLTGRGSPFDLLEIARAARRKGIKGKRWSER